MRKEIRNILLKLNKLFIHSDKLERPTKITGTALTLPRASMTL